MSARGVAAGAGRLWIDARLPRGTGIAAWTRAQVASILAGLALAPDQPLPDQPLSVPVVETLPDRGTLADPPGGDLGRVRIPRASPLTPVRSVCRGARGISSQEILIIIS